MSKKIKVIVMTLLVLVSIILAFSAGCTLAFRTSVPPEHESLLLVEQAWNIIFNDYVDPDRLDATALNQAAIKGMVEALDDPYTAYVDAETLQLGMSGIEGEYEGIGAEITIRDEQLVIIAPIGNSPAAQAGIKSGDIILEIDGKPTPEMSLTEAVLNVRGPTGTQVKLLVLHQDETQPVEIEITRAKIESPSIYFELREDIAYIYIAYFSERTDEELSQILESITLKEVTGIILDLRNNPGGLLDTVVAVTSYFLEEGIVVNVVDNQGTHSAQTVQPSNITTSLPLIVLVNSFSASGSEVLSGALQDYGRATIAGTKTFGKGSINILRQLADGSGIYITTGRWLTPNGRPIEGIGVYPDYELEPEEDAVQWAINYLNSKE